MLAGQIKNQIDRIWDAVWSGGMSNPLEVVEQITYLLFIKRLDDEQGRATSTSPRFVEKLFQQPSFRQRVSDLAAGSSGSMKNISQEKLRSIEVGLPSPDRQLEFEHRIERLDAIASVALRSTAELDALFASLQSRAFAGEL